MQGICKHLCTPCGSIYTHTRIHTQICTKIKSPAKCESSRRNQQARRRSSKSALGKRWRQPTLCATKRHFAHTYIQTVISTAVDCPSEGLHEYSNNNNYQPLCVLFSANWRADSTVSRWVVGLKELCCTTITMLHLANESKNIYFSKR